MTAAFDGFEAHAKQCHDAIEIYKYLRTNGYQADFGLRFVWVASISALDRYITELIVEKATEHFANSVALSAKLLNESVALAGMLKLHGATPAQAVVEFRAVIAQTVRFRTFQKADDISDGLAFVWNEAHKWDKIAKVLGSKAKSARYKLNNIGTRRDKIVHDADFDESTNTQTACNLADAEEVVRFITQLVTTIEGLVP